LGGDGAAQLARVCWVSHGQFVQTGIKARPRCSQNNNGLIIQQEQAKDS
jgi:hypothetical protein